MKVFISWSGERSKHVALALRGWLPKVIQQIEPWISASDIEKGSRWLPQLSEKLEIINFGIICLTPENQNRPWILFESGALSKKLVNSSLCPIILDIEPSSIKGPLSQFQLTRLQRSEMFDLVQTINNKMEDKSLRESQLKETFDIWWPKFQEEIDSIPKNESNINKDTIDKDRINTVSLQIVGDNINNKVFLNNQLVSTKLPTVIENLAKGENIISLKSYSPKIKESEKPLLAWYENNRVYTDSIRHYLEEFFRVKIFNNANTAEENILSFEPDVIIFDLWMEGLSGSELFLKLKEKHSFKPIFLTVWAQDNSTIAELEGYGVNRDSILSKNLEVDSIVQSVLKIHNCA